MVLVLPWECMQSYKQNIKHARNKLDQSGVAGQAVVKKQHFVLEVAPLLVQMGLLLIHTPCTLAAQVRLPPRVLFPIL